MPARIPSPSRAPGVENEEARALLGFLTAPEQQSLEAGHGAVPVRRSVMENQRREATGMDAERLALLDRSIQSDLIIPPKLSYYPEIEDILWRTVRAAIVGEVPIPDALADIEARIAKLSDRR